MDIRNFELIVDDLEKNPHCLHGPTIIFIKNVGKKKKYYACSACRDKKNCNFYQPVDGKKKILLKTSNFWKEQQKKLLSSIEKLKPYNKLNEILSNFNNSKSDKINTVSKVLSKNAKSVVGYCYTCNCLFDNKSEEHKNCNVVTDLTYYQLTHPTSIIIPKTDAKTHAQYFFSESSVKDIYLLLSRLKATKVLCIGVPKIHEHIISNDCIKMKSLLLDFDKNYYNFYNKNNFIWYNMFNNYIFDETQKEVLCKYFQSGKIVVLMDPPFGGRVEPLARTLNMLNKTFLENNNSSKEGSELQIFWFFPYFMEKHIKDSLPNFKMFDYKVNYDNHTSFTDTGLRKRKFGSPVRIFTNFPLGLLDLEGVPGYKFCTLCGYWVSKENRHCNECNACTSKDGRTYTHCDKCSKCVKPSYKHCDTCSRCCLINHICGEFQPDNNCYHCHQPGHKKSECSLLNIKKRKNSMNLPKSKKKRKVVPTSKNEISPKTP